MSEKYFDLNDSNIHMKQSKQKESFLWLAAEFQRVKETGDSISLMVLEYLIRSLAEDKLDLHEDSIQNVYNQLCNDTLFSENIKRKKGFVDDSLEERIANYIDRYFLEDKKIKHIGSIRVRPLIEEVRQRYISELKKIIDERKDNDWIVYVYIKMVKCLEQLNRLDINYLEFDEVDAICEIIGARFFNSKVFFDYKIDETIDFRLNCLIMNVLSKIIDKKKLKYEFEIPSISGKDGSNYLTFKLVSISPCRRASLSDSGLFKCIACISDSDEMLDYEEYRLPIVVYKKDDIIMKIEGFDEMMKDAVKNDGHMKPIVDSFMFKYL